jgi:hypothetical protein
LLGEAGKPASKYSTDNPPRLPVEILFNGNPERRNAGAAKGAIDAS